MDSGFRPLPGAGAARLAFREPRKGRRRNGDSIRIPN